jgi:hypothetical protein
MVFLVVDHVFHAAEDKIAAGFLDIVEQVEMVVDVAASEKFKHKPNYYINNTIWHFSHETTI